MTDCLNSMNLTEINYDPTDKFNRSIREAISNSDAIFDKKEMYSLKNSHPSIPIVYGLPKIHKSGVPVRPVSASYNAPSQILCKKLSKLLPDLINFEAKYAIKNTKDLVDRIKNLRLPNNAKLVSFDVCSLFTSVPIVKLKKLLFDKIKIELSDNLKSSQLINLINICLKQNYFRFDDKIYLQNDGLAMGSALSPFLAEFFMDYIEKTLFDYKHPLLEYIFTWIRYVDDVFCIWTGTKRQLDNFLNNILNKLDDHIKFTIELGNNSINFLDLTINIIDNRFAFNIFRKDTYSDAVIPSNSVHPWNVKMASFHSMLNRLLDVPLSQENFKKELNVIKLIARNNGYNNRIIYKLLAKKQYKKAVESVFPVRHTSSECVPGRWKRIPYLGKISEDLKKPLLEKNVRPAFFNRLTLKNLLINNKLKPTVDKLDKCGVYQLNCQDCGAIYIGQTKRSIKTRYKEHINNSKNNNPNTGFAKHLSSTGHGPDSSNIKLLHNISEKKLLDRYETFEIKKAKDDGCFIVNDQIDFKNNSPLLSSNLIQM